MAPRCRRSPSRKYPRLRADRRHARLDPRVAERALLRLAGVPVEVDLLVRAPADAHPPAAAALLVDEDDAVLLALVHRSRRARRDTRRVQAVLADARQVHHEHGLVLGPNLLLDSVAEVRVQADLLGAAAEVVLPVGSPGDVERRAGHARHGSGDRLVAPGPRGDQGLVVVGPGLVVVVQVGEVGVGEDRGELSQRAAGAQAQAAAAVELPAPAPVRLVLPALRIPDAGLRLDVVEPHVLRAGPVRPHVLAGHRARVAADALVEVHDHADLRHDPHQYVTSDRRRRTIVSSSRWLPIAP